MKKKRLNTTETVNDKLNTVNEVSAESDTAIKSKVGRFRSFNVILIAVCLTLSVLLMTELALSWLEPKSDANYSLYVTDFSVKTMIYLPGNESDGESGDNYKELTDSDKIKVGVTDANVSNVKLRVDYTGPSSAYIRVQLFETFKNSQGGIYPSTEINYTIAPGWEYKDGYFYYKQPVKLTNKDSEVKTIDFINSISTGYNTTAYDGIYFNIVAVAECVQPDRFAEFFGAEPETIFGS